MKNWQHIFQQHTTLHKRAIAWFLVVTLLFSLWLQLPGDWSLNPSVKAATQIGTVINLEDSNLNVRSGPGTSYSKVGSLAQGAVVNVHGSATAANGALWHQISYVDSTGATVNGYAHSYYLSVTDAPTDTPTTPSAPPATDAEFEAYLTAQGFPESYKPMLRTLHAQHPSWIFEAMHTNLDWKTVLDAECIIGRNLVPSSSLASWKSMEKGAYNWSTNTWYGLDGSGWVAASREIIAYYLDPRNALDDTAIFQFESLSYSPYHTASGVDAILKNTFMSGSFTTPDTKTTYTYTETFMKAAEVSGVSPYHLASRARQEQGVNGSPLSLGTVPGYENYFNFFNVRAYATSSASALVNGAIYAKSTNTAYYLPWTNQYKSILGGAAILASGYISKQQDTLYLQKFDVVDGGNGYYSHQYMTNVVAPTSEATSLKKAYTQEMLNSTLVFSIPVYLNMPQTPAVKPTSSGNNNNFLSSLTVSGQTLTPTFDMYTMDYELVVASDVASVTVTAKALGSAATVSGTGTVALQSGENKISIAVTAASGLVRTYFISVYRTPGQENPEPPEETDPPADPVVSSDLYTLNTYVTGIEPGTGAQAFLQHITVKNGTAKLSSDTVGTGTLLQIYSADGKLFSTYPLVIYGDVNGDGKISAMDLLAVQKHLLKISLFKDAALQAADVGKNGSVSAMDLLAVQKHLLKMTTISQSNVA